MADETAFFRFDTNAQDVASNIAGAMARIQQALAVGDTLDQGMLRTNTQAISQGFSRMEGDVRNSVQRVQGLLNDLSAQRIDTTQFTQQFQGLVREGLGDIRTRMGRELAGLPDVIFDRLPIQELGRNAADRYVETMLDTVRSRKAELGDAFRDIPLNKREFRAEVGAAGQMDFMSSQLDRMEQLRGVVRAERLIAQAVAEGYDVASMRRPLPRWNELGMGEITMATRDRAVEEDRLRFDQELDQTTFQASDAAAELSHLTREFRAGEAAARNFDKSQERTAAAIAKVSREADDAGDKLRQLLLAVAQVQSGDLTMYKGRLLGPDGLPLKPTTVGLEEEANPLRAAMTLQAAEDAKREIENARRLMEAEWRDKSLGVGGPGSMMAIGANRILETDTGPEVYRVTELGARRVTTELQITEALEAQRIAIEKQVAAQGRLAAAEERREQAIEAKTLRDEQEFARKNSGFTGGFVDRFTRNDTSFATSMGTSVASAAAFSMAYGGLFALQNALRDTLAEFKDYEDSLTDLEVATRDTDAVTSDFVHSLGELARWSGANMGQSLDTAARAIRAFGQPQGDTAEQQQAIGLAANEAATKLALITDKSLKDATGDVIAIGTAYEKTPDQLMQVVDAITNAKRTLGGDPAQIAQGLALIAGSATEAGYSLEQAAAVISLVQARTDQSGQAIATRLTRIFQIIAGSTGKALSRELGIDTTLPIKEQVEGYAERFIREPEDSPVRDRITSAAGGTANLRELLPLLKENERLQRAFEEAITNTGAATDEFIRKSDNVTGTLRRMGGTVSAIQVQLARSGLFAPFALAVEVLDPALSGLNRLLQVYNELNPVLKNMLGLYLNIAVAQKAVSLFTGGQAAAGTVASLGRYSLSRGAVGVGAEVAGEAVARTAETATMRTVFQQRMAAELQMNGTVVAAARGRAAAEAVGAGLSSTGSRLRGVLGSTVGRAGIAGAAILGGLAGYDYLKAGETQRDSFSGTARGAYEAWGRIDGSADKIAEAATDFRAAAGEISKDKSNYLSDDEQADHAAYLTTQAKGLGAVADRVRVEQERLVAAQDVGVFGSGVIETVDELAQGLAALDGSGQTAITRMRLLREALEQEPVQDVAPRFLPEQFASQLMGAITGSVLGALPAEGEVGIDTGQRQIFTTVAPEDSTDRDGVIVQRRPIVDWMGRSDAARELLDEFDPLAFQKAVLSKARGMGLRPGGELTQGQVDKLVAFGLEAVGFTDLVAGAPDFQRNLNEAVAELMAVTPKEARNDLINGTGPLSRQKIVDLLNPVSDAEGRVIFEGMPTAFEAELAAVPPQDDGTMRLALLKKQRDWYRQQVRRNTGEDIPQLMFLVAQSEDAFARAAVERLERLRVAAQNRPGMSRAEVRDVGISFLRREIVAARGSARQMIEIMMQADMAALDVVRSHLAAAAAIAKAAREARAALLSAATSASSANAAEYSMTEGKKAGRKSEAERVLDEFDRNIKNIAIPETGSVYSTGSDAPNYVPPKDPKEEAEKKKKEAEERRREREERQQAQAELIAARASVRAARLGGGIATARSAIIAARAQLAIAEKGTTEYYNALASFFSAQASLRDAIANYRTIRFRLRGDITDPVENARDELRGAIANLRAHRGMGKDVRAEDQLAVREARQGLLAERFNQRLQDAQTAEQLGKISFQAYLQYLDSEHDRLSRIKNKTRQQKDQLNQIDLAMKEALDSADGQFNLGDINTNGLVYQARRFAAQQRAALAGPSPTGRAVVSETHNVTIQIDGTDIGAVRRVLADMIGPNNGARRTLRSRKV